MSREDPSGSSLLVLLFVITLLSGLLLLLLQTILPEKQTTHSLASEEQAHFAAESGLSVAIAHLQKATRHHPAFLVKRINSDSPISPILLIGATNLINSNTLLPMTSSDLAFSTKAELQKIVTIDLNKNHVIAATASYLAPWVNITNSSGQPMARYAYLFLDEQARLNPILHQGKPRSDPDQWNQGACTLPLCLGNNNVLLTSEEAQRARDFFSNPSSAPLSLEPIFTSFKEYDEKKVFLSTDETPIPDLIPASLPDAGRPKYNLNDLATNPIYGATPSDRAGNIAAIIDDHLPLFKQRDPSLKNAPINDQCRYLNRLAACIVDYIDPDGMPIFVNGGEPAGRGLFPLVTQTAERCRISERTSNTVTIENQYFIQVWNPYTKAIPAGSKTAFSVNNRQRLHFGTATTDAFYDYAHIISSTPRIGPNQSIVLKFPSTQQTWTSPTTVPNTEHPSWKRGPEGNANPTMHQAFTFYWNDQLVDTSRRPPIGPGLSDGGLDHNDETLTNNANFWQCDFIPTEQDRSGNYRFVGDPRENYLSNYLWKTLSGQKSYLSQTQWQGSMSDASTERHFSPTTTWLHRDFVPLNPTPGNRPSSLEITPDQIPSSYCEESDSFNAPFVLRNGPMNSIVELGNINDPAQADDLGNAPLAGSSNRKSSIYASGGGRTLRIGQPEFSYWDVPGKRAIELLDIFSVASPNNSSITVKKNNAAQKAASTIWRKGLINVNTAPHEVLMALFYGIMPTSDHRFTHSKITLKKADELATWIEKNRPYEKLSDLRIITPALANANTYEPSLSTNVISENQPLAAVFDRAREEAFGKMISLCTIQSRAFRVYIIGQSLDSSGKPGGEAMIEATLALTVKENQTNDHQNDISHSFDDQMYPEIRNKKWIE